MTALRVVQGGQQRTPPAPSWFNDDAKREWRRIMPALIKRRVLTDADMAQVENYCLQIAQARQLQRTIDGLVDQFVYSEGGTPRPHPAYRMQRDAMSEARRIANELGLTPASRTRPAAADPASGQDEWGGLVDD